MNRRFNHADENAFSGRRIGECSFPKSRKPAEAIPRPAAIAIRVILNEVKDLVDVTQLLHFAQHDY